MEKIKKINIKIISGILLISFIVNIIQLGVIKKIQKQNEYYSLNISPEYEYLDSMTVKSFERSVKNGDRVAVFIGRPDCGDCIYFEPTLEYLSNNYDIEDKIKYVNVKEYREEDAKRWENFKERYSFTQTPSFLLFENGKYVSGIEWSDNGLKLEDVLKWLNENNII